MNNLLKKKAAFIAALCLTVSGLILNGCGGGGSGGVGGAGGVSSQSVKGVAAAGAPIAGEVSIKDSSDPAKQKTSAIGNDGSFAFDVSGMKAPFMIRASGNSGGTNYTLYSFAPGSGIANVNPLANAAVASAAGVGDPAGIYDDPQSETLAQIKDHLPAAVDLLMGKLQPLLHIYGADSANPVSGHFVADHSGLDAMLDNVKVSLANGLLTVNNAATGSEIFSCQVTNIGSGKMTMANLPGPPTVPADPAAPAGVTATGGDGQVNLTWNSVSGATSYNIYWSTVAGVTTSNGTKLTNVTSQAVHSGLVDSTTYYYVLTAVNGSGESAPSVQVAATTFAPGTVPTIPAAPAGVSAAGGTGQVTVSWGTVTGATAYNLYWATSNGVTKTSGTRISGVTGPYVQTGRAAGTAYYYVVTAVNSAGESAASAQATATTNAVSTPACGSCHAIPPNMGKHSVHSFTSCVTCHGTGYSATTVNAATHNNGVTNLVTSLSWNATTSTCATPSCHGSRKW